jgi:Ca-activated chloride channel family protein
MEGDPIAYVKQACSHVVDLLTPEDLLSIITFEDQVDVVMPARRVVNKELIKQHIARIQVGRTTNLYDGILAACNQVASVPGDEYLRRVLLLTDGEPTSGIKDFASIVGLAAEQKSRGVVVTALGFGPEYNEELLAGMARRSGGNYYYISRPELIPEVFARELSTLLTVVASDVRLRLRLPRWVSVRQVYGLQPAYGPRQVEVPLVDLEAGANLAVLAELDLEPRPAGPYRVARAELTYRQTGSQDQATVLTADAEMEFVSDEQMVAQGVDPVVAGHVQVALASRELEKTVMGMRTQQLSPLTAALELQKTQALLVGQGRTEEARQVAQALEELQRGSTTGAEKTLIGTVYNLDRGKS